MRLAAATTATKRVLTATATLWLAGSAGGLAAEAPATPAATADETVVLPDRPEGLHLPD